MSKCLCCCPKQPHITNDARQHLVEHQEDQLWELSARYLDKNIPVYLIRRELAESDIPFKGEVGNMCSLLCCASCNRHCTQRCPQDILLKARLIGGNPPEGAPLAHKLLHIALTAELPRYDVISAMVIDILDAENHEMDYAPALEMEQWTSADGMPKYRPVADPITGDLKILNWPQTGMCPFCLPKSIVDRRRVTGGRGDYVG